MKQHLRDATVWRKRWEVLDRLLANELILLSDDREQNLVYVVRSPAGQLIWRLLSEARTPQGLARQIADARGHAMTPEDEREVNEFLSALADARLIEGISASAGAIDPPAVFERGAGDGRAGLERIELDKLRPDVLVLQGQSVGFHAAGHSHPGGAC